MGILLTFQPPFAKALYCIHLQFLHIHYDYRDIILSCYDYFNEVLSNTPVGIELSFTCWGGGLRGVVDMTHTDVIFRTQTPD